MSRLEPSMGVEIINDIRLAHTWYEVSVLENFIKEQKPKYFIEIGIHEGGLSYALIPKLSCYYIGIEINCEVIRHEVIKIYEDYIMTATLMCFDCFNLVIYNHLIGLDNKIIYCDGGNKALELSHFKSSCNLGDIIMAHDFHDGIRQVRDIPTEYLQPEIRLDDVQVYESDPMFERLSEDIFKETRIIGWKRIGE